MYIMIETKMQKYIDESLIRYVESKPDYKWEFKKLCKRVDVTSAFIKKFTDKGLCTFNLACNPKFQFSWVIENLNLEWDPAIVSENVFMNDIISHPEYPWVWTNVSTNKNITVSDMVENPNLPWNFHNWGWDVVGYEELRIIRRFHDKFNRADFADYTAHASWNIIKTNLDIHWVPMFIVFQNVIIDSPSDISALRYLNEREPFSFHIVSQIATLDLILSSLDLPWEWDVISARTDVEHDDLQVMAPWNFNYTPTKTEDVLIKEWNSAVKIQNVFRGMKARRILRESKLYSPGGSGYNRLIDKYRDGFV